jgi:hypothetical protein
MARAAEILAVTVFGAIGCIVVAAVFNQTSDEQPQIARPRPFPVTLIALFEFSIAAFLLYIFIGALAVHAANHASSIHDLILDDPDTMTFIMPASIAFHMAVGWGLWALKEWARLARIGLSIVNPWNYWQWGSFYVIECIPKRHPEPRTAYVVIFVDLLILCCLAFYPDIAKTFGCRDA